MKIDYVKYPFPEKIRHHVASHNYLPVTELKNIPENYPPLIKSMNWQETFANGNPPDVLDIGCGKGVFLINYAQENPGDNILGIEIRETPVEWINTVLDGEKTPNGRAIHYTVANGLPFIESGSVKRIFYLFPDPWPKTRHRKRRAFNPEFLDECSRVLAPDGRLWLATDVGYVHEYQLGVIAKNGKLSARELHSRDEWPFPCTNKENFCISKDIPVFRTVCGKS